MYVRHNRGPSPHGNFSHHQKTRNNPVNKGHQSEDSLSACSLYQPTTAQVAGEVLFHLRPTIYVAALMLCRKKRSWKPWFVSLIVDLISRGLSQSKLQNLNNRQRQALQGRLVTWLFYLVRSPMFDIAT